MTTMGKMPGRTFCISGLVIDVVTRHGIPGLRVEAWDKDLRLDDKLGSTTTDAQGKFQITFHESDFQDFIIFGEEKPDLYFKVFQNEILIKNTVDSVLWNVSTGETLITIPVNLSDSGGETKVYDVQGKVSSRVSASVGGLRVVVVDKGVGGDVQLAEAVTDDRGAYRVTFPDSAVLQRGKAQPDIQARVFTGEVLLSASDVHYNASRHETLNVLLQDEAVVNLKSEHEVLTSALAGQFKGKLADLKETDEQQDITYLANKTGWDARAVALTALADQFSARTANLPGATAIPQSFFYALFRAGLPANEDTLFHTDAKTLEGVWKQAAAQGVIAQASVEQIPDLVQRFQALSAQKLLTSPALIGASSFKEMLLSVTQLNDAQQARFAQLYTTNRTDMRALWAAVSDDAVFGNTPQQRLDVVNRLQVDGKLAFLTINNATLMQKVHATAGNSGLPDPLQLAQTGYYRTDAWNQLLTREVPVPQEIPGDTAEAKRANYAEYLATQVRLSYPTVAVAHMVKSGELPLTGAADGISNQVHAFLTGQQGQFEVGVEPVERYIARNKLQVPAETVTQVKRLQRTYQITPSDQAMTGLMKHGIDAAYHVVRYDRDTFIQNFAADLGGADPAAQTYDRAAQIHSSVLNVALSYLHARTAPAIGVHSPPSVIDPVPANSGDILAYTTLESLFGSMDFCACSHCRSILSPAAYLVDLLQFLDQPNPPAGTENPQTVLLERRPDIQHLPLTCDNTNTALPYIDLVNETLEYFVASSKQNPSMKDYQGHDTNSMSSEDLLASPQYVMDEAYKTLRDELFPAPLPFHQPLENLRRYFNKFEVPLPLAMERLCNTINLERGTNPYGWRDILMEEIDLSRAEYDILTTSNATAGELLWQIYGYPSGTKDTDIVNGNQATDIAALSNVKQFARRLGVSYEHLISILKTRFVNPNSDLLPKLEKLGVTFAVLAKLKTDNNTPNQAATDSWFDGLLANQATPPDPVAYGGDPNGSKSDFSPIRAWVKNDTNYKRIMNLITLAIPASTWAPAKVYALGDCVLPTAPPAGSTLYYQCSILGTSLSAAAEPKWPAVPGNTCKDGTVDWVCRDIGECVSFGNLAFRYSDPAKHAQNIGAVEFVRLLRFIRLWKKLGWTIEQTDTAICTLYRADLVPLDASDLDSVTKLDTGFLTLLPRLGIVSRVMKALDLTVKRDLSALLTCFASIGIHDGETWVSDGDGGLRQQTVASFYRQMFLTPTILQQDTVFTGNGYGEFLTDTGKKIADHAEALRSAFNLTGEELSLIAAELSIKILLQTPYSHPQPSLDQAILRAAPGIGYDDSSHQLSYPGTLSTKARDDLKEIAGVSPEFKDAVDALFAANPTLTPLTIPNISAIFRRGWLARKLKISVRELLLLIKFTGLNPFTAPDPVNPAILRLIELVRMMKDRSFNSATALYLIWNQDLSGKSAPAPGQITELARTLRGDYAAIDDQFAVTEAPNGDVARARMTLVYGQETSDAFFALLDDTLVVDVAYTQSASELEAAITAADPAIAYDGFRHRLSHRGLVTIPIQATLINLSGVSLDFQKAVKALFDRSEEIKGLFFTAHPELRAPYNIAVTQQPARRHSAFLAAFDPELARQRKRQQALQRISAATGADPALTKAILDPVAAPYPLHADVNKSKPALEDALSLEMAGLAARFFFGDTATGSPDQSIPAALPDYASGGNNPLPNSGNAISGIWSGLIEAPEAGFYNFVIETGSEATVTLTLAGQARALIRNGTIRRNTDPIELKAGTLYAIELKVEKVKDTLSLQWETPKRPRELIPSRYLYPVAIFEPFTNTFIRFLKTASLAADLGLTANELVFLATHSDYRVGGDDWLNALTVNGDPQPAAAVALLPPFESLLDFARIKADLSPSDESLLTVLKDPAAATQNAGSLLFNITRWNPASLNDVLTRFGSNIAGLGHFNLFRRVYDAFVLVRKLGISAHALIQAATNEPADNTVRDLQAALRARYDAESWRDVVRPVNDEMRSLQRDALVAYILHQMRSHPESAHIDTPEKLFEYFLMDVQMDPCMQTSRIRHALSSVQLFIERCLMNLEKSRVSPAAINAKQWEWMKRYRVWEANRKVYLYPENWLEPELRDGQSPFFKETMSELLQGDITEDRAAVALLNYLTKLEEVAKLEPCGIYHIPRDDAKRTPEISHVVARTAGASRKYFYRRYEGGSWTPWEQIKLDIEDNPVIPVVWNNRLFLFWLRILKEVPETAQKPGRDSNNAPRNITALTTDDIPNNPQITVQAMLCWSEYYNGKWQATKTSDEKNPISLGTFPPAAFDRSTLRLKFDEPRNDQLRIIVEDNVNSAAFLLFNTHSLPLPSSVSSPDSYYIRYFDTAAPTFAIHYKAQIKYPPHLNFPTFTSAQLRNVLTKRTPIATVQHNYDPNSPFFFEDRQNVFYVTTEAKKVWVVDFAGFGITTRPSLLQVPQIAPLVLQPQPKILPKFWGDGGPSGSDPGVTDPISMQRFVTEDAYIRQGIGTTGTVTFGNRQIGPFGAMIYKQGETP